MKNSKTLIFVVDDNEYNLKKMTQELRTALKSNVVGFTSPKDCLKEIYRKPDLIISDYYIEGDGTHAMNGGQMLSIIKQQELDIPVIMYSSHTSIDLAVKLLKIGAADFIPREEMKDATFLQKIEKVIAQQMAKIKEHHDEVRNKNVIIACCIAFCATVILVQYKVPDALPYVAFVTLVILTAIVFFGKSIWEKTKKVWTND